MVELMIALLVTNQRDLSSIIILSSLILMFNLRQRHPDAVNTFLVFLVVYYLMINLCVNSFDLCWNYAYKGLSYRRDADFTSSFSYKTHQLALTSMLAFISAQYFRPDIAKIKEIP